MYPTSWLLCSEEWPIFNSRKPLRVQLETDRELPLSKDLPNGHRKASGWSFPHNWMFLRDVRQEHYKWEPSKQLRLIGSAANLDTPKGTSTFVRVRQRHVESTMTVCLDFDPVTEHLEAGITAYVDTLSILLDGGEGPVFK